MSGASTKPRIDWTIPVPTIIVGAGQIAAIIIWATLMGAKLDATALRVDKLEGRMVAVESSAATIARLDERTVAIQKSVERLEARPGR